MPIGIDQRRRCRAFCQRSFTAFRPALLAFVALGAGFVMAAALARRAGVAAVAFAVVVARLVRLLPVTALAGCVARAAVALLARAVSGARVFCLAAGRAFAGVEGTLLGRVGASGAVASGTAAARAFSTNAFTEDVTEDLRLPAAVLAAFDGALRGSARLAAFPGGLEFAAIFARASAGAARFPTELPPCGTAAAGLPWVPSTCFEALVSGLAFAFFAVLDFPAISLSSASSARRRRAQAMTETTR